MSFSQKFTNISIFFFGLILIFSISSMMLSEGATTAMNPGSFELNITNSSNKILSSGQETLYFIAPIIGAFLVILLLIALVNNAR